jgi:hypothetical protein
MNEKVNAFSFKALVSIIRKSKIPGNKSIGKKVIFNKCRNRRAVNRWR